MSNLIESLKSLKEGFESATTDSAMLRDIKNYALSKGIHPAIVAGFVFYYANGEEGMSPEEWEAEGNGPMDPGELILSEFWQDYAKEAGLSVEGLGEVEVPEFSGVYTNSKNWKDAFDKWSSKFPRGESESGSGDWKDIEKLLSDWGFKIEEKKEGKSIFATKKLESDLVGMGFRLQIEATIPWFKVIVYGKGRGLGREFRNKLEDVAGQDLDMEFGEIFDYISIRSDGLGGTVTWLKNVVSKKVELFGGKVWDFCKRAQEDELREGLMESTGSYSGVDNVLAKLRGKGLKESFVGKLRESTEGVNETLIDSMRKCLELVEKKFRCWKKERSSDPDEVSYALTFKPDDIKGTLIKSLEAYVDFTASQKQWYLKIKVSADKCVVTYEGNPHPFDWVMSESYLDSNISKAIEFWGKRYDNMAREYGWPSRD